MKPKWKLCTRGQHYHLLAASRGDRFTPGEWDKKNQVYVWESTGLYEVLFSPFYRTKDGLWRSKVNPNVQFEEDVKSYQNYEVNLAGTGIVKAPIAVEVVPHAGAPEYNVGPYIHNPTALLALIGAPSGETE
ncbi:MAG: hypothetical protein JRN68_09560 [Nitrososphaerota archaeon]|nr:hypothetical protein [Ferrimicrobium acidiphilum]MDG6934927.1 hypothetical protein [Nitrososphaerota archaeon]